MTNEHQHVEPLTLEEDTEDRLRDLVERDYALIRALESQGVRITSRGYDRVILNPEVLGLEPPSSDAEHRELQLPRVRRRGLYLPMEDRMMTPLETCDIFMKTPQKKREFLEGCTRKPRLTRYIIVEAGAEFERCAIATAPTAKLAEELALKRLGATPDEPLRAVLLQCADDATASKVVEEKRDSLPWAEVQLRLLDGELPADWHGCVLSRDERARLEEQASRDQRAKRARRDKVIRAMQREPL